MTDDRWILSPIKHFGCNLRKKLGRLANGFERGQGPMWHWIPNGSNKSLCGTTTGRRSAGWGDPYNKDDISRICPKCHKKMIKIENSQENI